MRDDDAGARHRRNVDGVVADAVPRHDAQPAIGTRDRGVRNTGHVHVERIVARCMVRGDGGNDLGQVLPLEARRALQEVECRVPEGGSAARIEDVAREPDPEFLAHRHSLLSSTAARRTESPLPSACCSIS